MVEKVSIFVLSIAVYVLGAFIGKIIAKRVNNEKILGWLNVISVVIAVVLFINFDWRMGYAEAIGRSIGGVLLGMASKMRTRNG